MRVLRIGKPKEGLEFLTEHDETLILNNEWPDYPILDFVKLGVRNYGKIDYCIFHWESIEDTDKKKFDAILSIREMTEAEIIIELSNIENKNELIEKLEEKEINHIVHGDDEEQKSQLINIIINKGEGDIEEIKKQLKEKEISEDGPKIFIPTNKTIAILSWDAALRNKICFQLLNYLVKIKSNCELVTTEIDLYELLNYNKVNNLESFITSTSHEDSKTFTVLEAKSTAVFGKSDVQVLVINSSLQQVRKAGEFILQNVEGLKPSFHILVDGCGIENRDNVIDMITRTSNYYNNLDINFLPHNPYFSGLLDLKVAKKLIGENMVGK